MKTENETTNGIVVVNKAVELENRNKYMCEKVARIYTSANFDSKMPGMVGLSVMIEIETDGVKKQVGKTKAIKSENLPKIRAKFDEFGLRFTENVMEQTNEASFKTLLNDMLDSVINGDKKEED